MVDNESLADKCAHNQPKVGVDERCRGRYTEGYTYNTKAPLNHEWVLIKEMERRGSFGAVLGTTYKFYCKFCRTVVVDNT